MPLKWVSVRLAKALKEGRYPSTFLLPSRKVV